MTDLSCGVCHESFSPGDRYCESCGAVLDSPVAPAAPSESAATPGAACVDCGAAPDRIDADGYCGQCGRRQPRPRDHVEIELGSLAGVTDKGCVHPRNEDAMALAEPDPGSGSFAAVVCDGVSTCQSPDAASELAARTALHVLNEALATSSPLESVMADAIAAAQSAVASMPWDHTDPLGPPSCTFVAAVRRSGGPVITASVGDTRAYWFPLDPDADAAVDGPGPGRGGQRLTSDDSWAADRIAGGSDPAAAEADPRAHAITHWLGIDAPAIHPHLHSLEVTTSGRVVICSDGMWNYASTIEQMGEMAVTGSPIDAARAMTRFAIDQGGHDNITVVVIPADVTTNEEPP